MFFITNKLRDWLVNYLKRKELKRRPKQMKTNEKIPCILFGILLAAFAMLLWFLLLLSDVDSTQRLITLKTDNIKLNNRIIAYDAKQEQLIFFVNGLVYEATSGEVREAIETARASCKGGCHE